MTDIRAMGCFGLKIVRFSLGHGLGIARHQKL